MNTLTMTINPVSTSESIIQLAAGKGLAIVSGVITPTGLPNTTIYVDGVAGSTVTADYHRIVITFDDVACTDVQIGYDGSNYFDGIIGNVQLWDATFDANDVEYDYLNCYQNLTADNRPGTSLTSANLKGHWPLIEGSGDVAYDWSGNGNHGTLTNFPNDDSQWSNASALDSPLTIQTALCEWALKDSNNACVPLDTADSTNFTRDYSGLNWNGRSYADCGNGADVNPSTALIVEMVFKHKQQNSKYQRPFIKDTSFYCQIDQNSSNIRLRIYTDVEDETVAIPVALGDFVHIIYTYDVSSGIVKRYLNGSQYSTDNSLGGTTIVQSASNLILASQVGYKRQITAQWALFKTWIDSEAQAIIDDDLNAWVAKRYNKAKAKYNL